MGSDGRSALYLAGAGMVALALAMGLGRFAQTPILPFMIDELVWSKADAGWLASANFLGYFVGCLALGFLSVELSNKRFFVAVFFSAATTTLMAVTDQWITLAVLRFVGGIASASVLIMASTLIMARLDSYGRPQLGGLLFAGVGIGIAVSALVAEGFGHWGWQWLWALTGGIAAIGVGLIVTVAPADGGSIHAAAKGLPDRLSRLRYLLPAYGLVGMGYVITATFISTILRETPALAHLETAAWLVVGLSGAPSIWFWNKIASATSQATAFAFACIVEAIGVLLAVTALDPFLILISAAMLGGTFMGLTAMGLARARIVMQNRAQAAIALMSAAFAFGQMIGPAFAGILADWTGSLFWPSVVAATGLFVAAGLALLPDPT